MLILELMRRRELFGVWKVVVEGVVVWSSVMMVFVIFSPEVKEKLKHLLSNCCVMAEVQLYGLAPNHH